ncbi:MAG: DUF2752 domain-containing protein [Oscillospiraceae bacterium]|nr:DUF2752 domain-containing protein [Oscillospiraceae bacterium]
MKKRLFAVALFWGAVGLVCLVLLLRPRGSGFGLPCVIHSLTGLYCPGCGASRALASLLRLELYQAFRWNPLLVVLLPFALFYLVWGSVSWVRCGRNTLDDRIPSKLLWVLVAVVVLYFPLRNLPWWPFVLLQPTPV